MSWLRRNGLYIVILAGILAVLTTFGWRLWWGVSLHGFSNEAANVAVTGFAAIGTLLAVGVALMTARDATARAEQAEAAARRREDLLRREAQDREAQIRHTAMEREDLLRREAEDREERAQHAVVRPAISARASWDGKKLVVSYYNEGRETALRFRAGYEYTISDVASSFVWVGQEGGQSLRPLLSYRRIELDLWQRSRSALSQAVAEDTERLGAARKALQLLKSSRARRIMDWLYPLMLRWHEYLIRDMQDIKNKNSMAMPIVNLMYDYIEERFQGALKSREDITSLGERISTVG